MNAANAILPMNATSPAPINVERAAWTSGVCEDRPMYHERKKARANPAIMN